MTGRANIAFRGGLVAIVCLLAAWIANTILSDRSLPNISTQKDIPGTPLSAGIVILSPPAIENYHAILQRPLFHWSRRPLPARPIAPQQITSAPQMPLAPPPFMLRGTLLSPTKQVAIFEKPGQPDYIRLHKGQEIDGWTLSEVEQTRALLIFGGRQVTLELAPTNQQ